MKQESLTTNIDKSQFENLLYKVLFYNLTSDTELLVPDLLRITEISKTKIVISAPANTCAVGHQVELFLFIDEKRRTTYSKELLGLFSEVCSVKGKVTSIGKIDTLDGKFVSLEVSLEQFDPKILTNLIEKIGKREKELNSILEEANSYD